MTSTKDIPVIIVRGQVGDQLFNALLHVVLVTNRTRVGLLAHSALSIRTSSSREALTRKTLARKAGS